MNDLLQKVHLAMMELDMEEVKKGNNSYYNNRLTLKTFWLNNQLAIRFNRHYGPCGLLRSVYDEKDIKERDLFKELLSRKGFSLKEAKEDGPLTYYIIEN